MSIYLGNLSSADIEGLQNKYRYWEKNVYNKIPDKANHKWFEEHGFSNF